MKTTTKKWMKNWAGLLAIFSLVLLSNKEASALTYYSKTSGGFWNDPATWSTVTYGDPTNTGTYPRSGDFVFIGDGYDVWITSSCVASGVTIGQGGSGNLFFHDYGTYTMTIAGNLTIQPGASFSFAGNRSRTHNLFISGNVTNQGIMDMYSDANDVVNIVFNSRSNTVITGAGTFDLNRVTLYKFNSTYTLDVQNVNFGNATRWLVMNYGNYIHNNAATYTVNTSFSSFQIDPEAIFTVPQGTVHFIPAGNDLYLQGSLRVTGGTARVGSSAGTGGIRYDQNAATVPTLQITAGQLEVYGGITYRSGASTDPFSFQMSGGNLLLNTGSTGTGEDVFRITNQASSQFVFDTGTIVIVNPSSSSSGTDFSINGTAGTVNIVDGIVQFGNTSTPANAIFNFESGGTTSLPNFRISGQASDMVTLATAPGSTSDYRLKSLYIESGKVFDNRSISGTPGDSKTMYLTGNMDGVNAFFNDGTFIPRTGTVVMEGGEGQQINGNTTTTFYNLRMNNPFGVALARDVEFSNSLDMQDGILFTTSSFRLIGLNGASSNSGNSTSFVDGPMTMQVAGTTPVTLTFPVGEGSSHRPMDIATTHTDATLVDYVVDVNNSSARSLGYGVPGTLTWVSDIRQYSVNRSAVPNLSSASITLSYGTDDIVTDQNNLRVAMFDGSSSWLDLGGTGTASTTGTITSASMPVMGTIFTLGNGVGGGNPLPVSWIGFSATPVEGRAKLTWSTASETNSNFFEVQHSMDGVNFTPIGSVLAAGSSSTIRNYTFHHELPSFGRNFYRLRQVDFNGSFTYSTVRSALFGYTLGMGIGPNPGKGETFTLRIPNAGEGVHQLVISDASGKTLHAQTIDGSSFQQEIVPQQKLASGMYQISVTGSDGSSWNEKLLIID